MPVPISHYCQKCLAANPLGQDLCGRCGTRLMIVVEPSSARFEAGEHAVSTDEHLLERISIVENRITRLTERLERTLDLLLRQAQNSYFDRSLIKSLIAVLSDDGLVENSRLERLWNERCEQDAREQQELSNRETCRQKILETLPEQKSKEFSDLVSEAFHALEDRRTVFAIEKLQRAAEMVESNAALNLFLGEHFFKHGRMHTARPYLTKVHQAIPNDLRIRLLLALTCIEEGDCETAKLLLQRALDLGGSCFAAHCGLGWVHMTENNSRKAVTQFKRALQVRPSPEAHFVLASLYFKLKQDSLAIRHLKKAIEMDDSYYEALSLLALVYQRSGKERLAQEALKRAEGQAESLKKSNRKAPPKTGHLFDETKPTLTGLMKRNRRLASVLRDDALWAFAKVADAGS